MPDTAVPDIAFQKHVALTTTQCGQILGLTFDPASTQPDRENQIRLVSGEVYERLQQYLNSYQAWLLATQKLNGKVRERTIVAEDKETVIECLIAREDARKAYWHACRAYAP